jgi:hypothetical protein
MARKKMLREGAIHYSGCAPRIQKPEFRMKKRVLLLPFCVQAIEATAGTGNETYKVLPFNILDSGCLAGFWILCDSTMLNRTRYGR